MRELFQGRRFGFAPRPILAFLAVGLAIGVTLVDLMAYFAWGSRETNGYVVVAYWLAIGTTIVAGPTAVPRPPLIVDVCHPGVRPAPARPGGPAGAVFSYARSAACPAPADRPP